MSEEEMKPAAARLGMGLIKEVGTHRRQLSSWVELSAERRGGNFLVQELGEELLKNHSSEQLALIAAQFWLERQALATAIQESGSHISVADAAAFTSEALKAFSKAKWGKGGRARTAESTKRKHTLLKEWDAQKHEYVSRADFARIVSKREGMIERTLYDWITKHERAKA
ncbi:hypothetical protein [Stutzerimonas kunmingensis]|uniref:hypothetical protein n=1 Tax=Stutzerimonas kunmingensis TaxID=1211807 RepID=UPI00289D1225|nr:hypothetical protein [Stutzerimonas kunmingensis]